MSRPEVPNGQVHRRQVFGGVAAVGLGTSVLAACGSDSGDDSSAGADGSADGGADGGASSSGGDLSAADVPEGGGVILADQETVVTQPEAGEYKAFSAICTHQGCAVSSVTDTIECACHGSKFSLTDGSVVNGPATEPLPEKSVTVDGDSLTLG